MSRQFFAQLNYDNIVIDVHVVTAEFIAANPERYLGVWVETFFDTTGKTYAGIGWTYDYDTQDFVAPQPYPSWTLNSNHDWQPPTPKPEGDYSWNEAELMWVAI